MGYGFASLFPAGVVALSDAATITADASLGAIFSVTIAGDRTIADPINPVQGQKIIYRIKQDGTGNRTISWGPSFRFAGGTLPTLSTDAGSTDYLGFIYNAADGKWDCVAERMGYAP